MKIFKLMLLPILVSVFAIGASSQGVVRTTYKTDKVDFGSGGTLEVIGAPAGSTRVEGWSNNEVEISATIEIKAATEADIAALSDIIGYVMQESPGSVSIVTTGTHDKQLVKKLKKKLSKSALAAGFKVDYVIKVPRYTDIQIDGGKGDVDVSGVEGAIRINYLDSNAKIALVGGALTATVGSGTVSVEIPTRSWRGQLVDVQLAKGVIDVRLPSGLNAEVDASVLRTGKIENSFADLKPKTRKQTFTDRLIAAKAGVGGVPLSFTVGDGTLKISTYAPAP